jgi:hypothetical protein
MYFIEADEQQLFTEVDGADKVMLPLHLSRKTSTA